MDIPSLKVFLSHASKNKDIMKEIVIELEAKNCICWYDQRDIPYGDNYLTEILDAIDQVDVVILLHSQEVHDSNYVYREIQYADNKNKFILPVMIDDAPPARKLELIISTMQMLLLSNFPSIELAVGELYQRMEDYQVASQQGGYSSSWLQRMGKRFVQSNLVQLGPITAFKLKESNLNEISRVYEPIPNYQEISTLLLKERRIILQHEQRTGKYTTGVSLLLDQSVEQVIEILPTVTMLDLIKVPLKSRTGYIIDKADLLFFDNSTAIVWSELQERLQQVESFLVVTTKESFLPEGMGSCRVNRPEPTKVFNNHLNEQIDTLDYSYPFDLNVYLDGRNPFEVVEMVGQFLPVLQRKQSLFDFQERFQTRIEDRAVLWFKEHGSSLDKVAHYVALAVLKSTVDRVYLQSVSALKKLLDPLWTSEQMLLLTDEERLNILNAKRYFSRVKTDLGYQTEDGICLKYPEEGKNIVLTFWKMFPTARALFLNWLEQELISIKKTEKESIEEILSELANQDFIIVRQVLLQKWAKHKNANFRFSAVQVLSRMVLQNNRAQEVSNLINSWANQENNPRLHWTAAIALGTEVGLFMYPKSLHLLKKIFLSNPKELRQVGHQSFVNHFELGSIDSIYDKQFFLFFQEWLIEEKQKTRGGTPIAFLYFFFSIIRQREVSWLSSYSSVEVREWLEKFVAEAMTNTDTKLLAQNLLAKNFKYQHVKLAPLVGELLYHKHQAISERTSIWLKEGMQSQESAFYLNLYKEIKKFLGRN